MIHHQPMYHCRTPYLPALFLLCFAAWGPGTGAGFAAYAGTAASECDLRLSPGFAAAPDTVRLPQPPPVGPGLAPGTVKVRVDIIKLDTSARDIILTVRIEKILGFGAATPRLAAGAKVTTDATSYFTRLKQPIEDFKPVGNAVAVISHTPAVPSNRPAPEWSLVELDRYTKSQN